MSSKTKIVVLHLKELIYTGIFVVLGILFLLLLIIMFLPGKKTTPEATGADEGRYTPGKYTTSLILGNSAVDVEVVVDDNNINSIRLVNLDEAVTTMYPLMEPALNDLAAQICEKQSLDEITYSDDNKYTSQVLLDAITNALSKAEKNPGSTKEKSTKSKTSLEPIEETTPAAPAESTPSAENTAETTLESNQENAAENTAENTPETSADTPAETAAAAE
ncbi:hypothetical protein [Eisenbergiella massiliensis]|uniref:hypothetical protein n=1 Tax=Eisenbergiella massiliensis TaxID=1720294 RepID=UPI002ED134DD